MFEDLGAPPSPVILNAQAVSGILGSISIACWVIVFGPQIYENFYRKSAEGLSMLFVILWLIGDIFNVIGSILQNVLPTMLILAIYYTLADIVLVIQCLLYGTSKSVDPIHLSPANPLSEDILDEIINSSESTIDENDDEINETNQLLPTDSEAQTPKKKNPKTGFNKYKSEFYNFLMIALVLVSGIGGWYISYIRSNHHDSKTPPDHDHDSDEDLEIDYLGQFFGYLCAFFYLGSRIPQILLNYRRKSCDGVSFMFFFFACMGNLTYVLSILCIGITWKYLIINFSWLLGSSGTLALDIIIFIQFFLYNEEELDNDYESIEEN